MDGSSLPCVVCPNRSRSFVVVYAPLYHALSANHSPALGVYFVSCGTGGMMRRVHFARFIQFCCLLCLTGPQPGLPMLPSADVLPLDSSLSDAVSPPFHSVSLISLCFPLCSLPFCSGLRHLNEQKNRIIHYDLKPGNILFHQGSVSAASSNSCIARSTVFSSCRSRSMCVTHISAFFTCSARSRSRISACPRSCRWALTAWSSHRKARAHTGGYCAGYCGGYHFVFH